MTWPLLDPKTNQLMQPMWYQLDFALSRSFATGFFGGWGGGKSYGGLVASAISSQLSAPNSAGIVMQPSFPMMSEWLNEQFLPAFAKIIVHHAVGQRCIYLPGDRRIYYKSGYDPTAIQMTNASWVYVDEPHLMGPEVWKHLVARARDARSKPRILLTTLPRVGWLSEVFDHVEYRTGEGTPDYRAIHVETGWNKYLDPGYVQHLKGSCPRRMWRAYLGGQFVPLGGSVYPEYNPAVHAIPYTYRSHVELPSGVKVRAPVTLAIDYSPRNPHILFIQRMPAGVLLPRNVKGPPLETTKEVDIVIDELYPDGMYQAWSTERLCSFALAHARKRGYDCDEVVQDVAGNAVQSSSGESDAAIARRVLGLPVLGCVQGITAGTAHVKLALEPLVGHPTLFLARAHLVDKPFDSDEKRIGRSLHRALQAYSYSSEARPGQEALPVKDGVSDHACDCVRYHVYYHRRNDRLSADVRRIT